MGKILQKALKDGIKEKKCQLGTKQVLQSIDNSKLIIMSESVQKSMTDEIEKNAKKSKIPTVNFEGSSVALGKLCGLQFRVSSVSFSTITDTNIKSILKESEKE